MTSSIENWNLNEPDFTSPLDGSLDSIRANYHYLLMVAAHGSVVLPGWNTTVTATDYSEPDTITLTRDSQKIVFNYTWTDGSVSAIQMCYVDGVNAGSYCFPEIPFYYDDQGNPVGSTNPNIIFYDTFTGLSGDDITVSGHTPDVDIVGGGWAYLYNTSTGRCHEINSGGRAVCPLANSISRFTAFDSGVSDNYTIEATHNTTSGVNWLSNANTMHIVFRFNNLTLGAGSTGWRFYASTTGVWVLQSHSSGTWTTQDTGGLAEEDTTYAIKIVVSGNNIDCYVDNVLTCSAESAHSSTGQLCGIGSYGGTGAMWIDDFLMTAN